MNVVIVLSDNGESARLEAEGVDHFVLCSTPRESDALVRAGRVHPFRVVMMNAAGASKWEFAMGMFNVGETATILSDGVEYTVTKERSRE